MDEQRTFNGNHYRSSAALDAWLLQRSEPTIEPELPIVDAHHHLSPHRDRLYEVPDFVRHIGAMNVTGTVFVECGAAYSGAVEYTIGVDDVAGIAEQPVAETRYVVNSVHNDARADRHGLCAAIVGFVNLVLGEKSVAQVLESHIKAGEGRFRGARQSTAWDPFIGAHAWRSPPPGLLLDERFQSGFRALAACGLSFDAWLYFPQLFDLVLLARRFPEVPIVLNHCGGLIGVGPYADWPEERFRLWSRYIGELSKCENVVAKISGFGMPTTGSQFHFREAPPTSEELARAWKPYIDVMVEAFGPHRAMIASNFPVDRQTADYTVLWNAYKRATQDYRPDERRALFGGTATAVYKLNASAASNTDARTVTQKNS